VVLSLVPWHHLARSAAYPFARADLQQLAALQGAYIVPSARPAVGIRSTQSLPKGGILSTVLWANLLVGGQVTSDESDKLALHKHADKLDAISRRLGLGSFLDICDTTDLRFNADEFELPEGVESTNEVMATQGTWLEVAQAIRLLDGLLTHLRQNKVRFGLLSNDYEHVLSELAEALAYAQAAEHPTAKFNFSIVT
jgi:hypothetical protein